MKYFLSALLIAIAFSSSASAQPRRAPPVVYELACPAGYSPVPSFGKTLNSVSGNWRANVCVSDKGDGTMVCQMDGCSSSPPAEPPGSRPTLQLSDKARWALWEASDGVGNAFTVTNDQFSTSDSGANTSWLPPAAQRGMVIQVNLNGLQSRAYHGQEFAWPGRYTRFSSVLILTDDVDAVGATFFIGLSNLITAAADPTSAVSIGFYVTKTAGGFFGTWAAVCSVRGVKTTVDATVPIVQGPRYRCSFTLKHDSAIFFVDSQSVATIRTHLPLLPLAMDR